MPSAQAQQPMSYGDPATIDIEQVLEPSVANEPRDDIAEHVVNVSERPPRVLSLLEIELTTRTGRRRYQVRDISLTGLYVQGVTSNVGREVPLTLELPGEAPLEVKARVVRCDRGDHRGVGLTFSGIGWDDLVGLARYLAPRI